MNESLVSDTVQVQRKWRVDNENNVDGGINFVGSVSSTQIFDLGVWDEE